MHSDLPRQQITTWQSSTVIEHQTATRLTTSTGAMHLSRRPQDGGIPASLREQEIEVQAERDAL